MEVGHFYVTKDHRLVRLTSSLSHIDFESIIPKAYISRTFQTYTEQFEGNRYGEKDLPIEKEIDITELIKVEKLKRLHYMYMRNEAFKCVKMKRTNQKLVIGENFVYFGFKCNEFTLKDNGTIEPGYSWFNKGIIYINKTESDILEEHHFTFIHNLREMYDNLVKF